MHNLGDLICRLSSHFGAEKAQLRGRDYSDEVVVAWRVCPVFWVCLGFIRPLRLASLKVYIYMCVYIYVYTCICRYTYTKTHTYIHLGVFQQLHYPRTELQVSSVA